MNNNEHYQAGLYCRLSKDDDRAGESISIGTQRAILADYCAENQFSIHKFYIDDGYSGLNFNRPRFLALVPLMEKVTNHPFSMLQMRQIFRMIK